MAGLATRKAHGPSSVGFIRKFLPVPSPHLVGKTKLDDAADQIEVAGAANAAAGVDPGLAGQAGAEHQVAVMNAAGALHARFHFEYRHDVVIRGLADYTNAAKREAALTEMVRAEQGGAATVHIQGEV